ncbi:hypothetical protein ACHHYP_02287 [Achlya hypogyna]|uniref:Uncharacterized protein n=1 Tax=Achlya hypogyna TaxID=1202772 RepID=A0A1V9Z762_ACHHY|nr:hypothetical protein ACHHYP_02287 [Achlya hypogyna]
MHTIAVVPAGEVTRSESRWSWYDVAGIFYVIASVAMSFVCVSLAEPYLQSDSFWPDFTPRNVSAVLSYAFNVQLTFTNVWNELLLPSLVLTPLDMLGVNSAYPRKLMYEELSTVATAIPALRRLDTTNVAFLSTQYCWADLDHRWAMAHTAVRQRRCETDYATNGAVYLEAILRNINISAWLTLSGAAFYEHVANPIGATPGGAAWVDAIAGHEMIAVTDEIALWTAHGLSYCRLSYSNRFQIGVEETISLGNSFITSVSAIAIKSISAADRTALVTSYYASTVLQYDFMAVGANESLVRNTPSFFGTVDATQIETFAVGLPLSLLYSVAHNEIGPLGSIDLYWVSPPPLLVAGIQAFRSAVLSVVQANPAMARAFAPISHLALTPVPPQWRNDSLVFYGGNPFCGYGLPLPFVQQSWGFGDVCAAQTQFTTELHGFNGLFAYAMLGDEAVGSACALTREKASCAAYVTALRASYAWLPASVNVSIDATTATVVRRLAFMQYIGSAANASDVTLQQQKLVEGAFAFFGWAAVYDWVLNQRGVVSFQGDVQTLDLVSYYYIPLAIDSSAPLVESWAQYLRYCMYLTSAILLLVGTVAIGIFFAFGLPTGAHWFVFNRITSSVWLNRGLLLLRSLVATICLSTAPTVPTTTAYGWTHFATEHRSLLASVILAGETTWTTYVVAEVLHPVTGALTRRSAPWSAALSWLLVAALDVFGAIPAEASVQRSCYAVNMDYMIYCNSGHASIRSFAWMAFVGVINVGSVVLTLAVVRALRKPGPVVAVIPNLLLPPAAVAFYRYPHKASGAGLWFDPVTLAFCGIVQWRGRLFDTKLWLPVRKSDVRAQLAMVWLPHCIAQSAKAPVSQRRGTITWQRLIHRKFHAITLGAGFAYLLASLSGNIVYLSVVQQYLANDYGWAGYNSTGVRAFLANVFNAQLLCTRHVALALESAALSDWKQRYNGSETTIVWSATMARRQLYDTSVSLPEIVQGLRDMNPCALPWMFTQYCWLDFGQMWAMASTASRQSRCQARASNAALYLESGLRNLNSWPAWEACWGSAFEIGFSRELRTTAAGLAWLQAVADNANDVAAEVLYWRKSNLTHFVLQWQNFKTVGIMDSISIFTALGMKYPVVLSALPGAMHLQQQTSMKMYWSFASDLWAVTANGSGIGGCRLLSNSPTFAFSNATPESLLITNLTLASPLTSGFTALRSAVGPFNAIDMVYLPPPRALIDLYQAFMAAISTLVFANATVQTAFISLPVAATMGGLPAAIANASSAGNDLLCGNDVPPSALKSSQGYTTFFGMNSMCHSFYNEYMFPSAPQVLFGILLAEPQDVDALCALDVYATASCAANYKVMRAFVTTYRAVLPDTTLTVAALTAADVLPRIAFYLHSGSGTSLFTTPLLDAADRVWNYYGWCYYFAWAAGLRDVVAFSGDAGSLAVITARTRPLEMAPDAGEIPQSLAYLFQAVVQYITSVLIAVAALVAISALSQRGHVEGLNLFELNRIVGHVWIGRLFLTVRSVTAMWLLNTSTLQLAQVGVGTRFIAPRLAWYKTILAGAESTWLVYVLNDLFSALAGPYTSYYAVKSALGAWIAVASWTAAAPQAYAAAIDRSCSYTDMDLGLTCHSGFVAIGDASRVVVAVLVCVGAVLSCYVLERVNRPNLPALAIPTQLLNAQSLYMLDLTDWVYNGEYFLDKTSALMAGILAVEVHRRLYVLDVKSWRCFSIAAFELDRRLTSNGAHERLSWAIPLSRI